MNNADKMEEGTRRSHRTQNKYCGYLDPASFASSLVVPHKNTERRWFEEADQFPLLIELTLLGIIHLGRRSVSVLTTDLSPGCATCIV